MFTFKALPWIPCVCCSSNPLAGWLGGWVAAAVIPAAAAAREEQTRKPKYELITLRLLWSQASRLPTILPILSFDTCRSPREAQSHSCVQWTVSMGTEQMARRWRMQASVSSDDASHAPFLSFASISLPQPSVHAYLSSSFQTPFPFLSFPPLSLPLSIHGMATRVSTSYAA